MKGSVLSLLLALLLPVLPAKGQGFTTVSLRHDAAPAAAVRLPLAAADSLSPWSLSAGTLLLGAGMSPFFSDALYRQNLLIREQVQLWRQERWHFHPAHVDNVMQFLPLATSLGMYWLGAESRHRGSAFFRRAAGSCLFYAVTVLPLKWSVSHLRPDRSADNSFPSGHTAIAFVGAEFFRLEYGGDYPWLSAALYAVAAGTGMLRIYNDRHWTGDVLAGAGLGILSVQLSHWLNAWLFE